MSDFANWFWQNQKTILELMVPMAAPSVELYNWLADQYAGTGQGQNTDPTQLTESLVRNVENGRMSPDQAIAFSNAMASLAKQQDKSFGASLGNFADSLGNAIKGAGEGIKSAATGIFVVGVLGVGLYFLGKKELLK